MHIQVYLKIVGALVEVMLRLGHQRFIIVLMKQPLLLHLPTHFAAVATKAVEADW